MPCAVIALYCSIINVCISCWTIIILFIMNKLQVVQCVGVSCGWVGVSVCSSGMVIIISY